MRRYRIVDVFSEIPYLGNPVAVVLDADGLSTQQMQRVAAWTNLSETTFVLTPAEPTADYRLRIFTPVLELPFAGHPTLGSCHAWMGSEGASAASFVQECDAGLVRIRAERGRLAFAAPPLFREGPVEESLLLHIAAALNIERGAILDAEWVDNGPGWVAVLLEDAAAVLAMRPGFVDLDLGVVGPYPNGPGAPAAFEVRAFFPKDGTTVEDPVTGSLNASLAPWLLRTRRATAPYVVSQGTALGRRGRVQVDRDEHGTVWVGGATVTCVSGEIDV